MVLIVIVVVIIVVAVVVAMTILVVVMEAGGDDGFDTVVFKINCRCIVEDGYNSCQTGAENTEGIRA